MSGHLSLSASDRQSLWLAVRTGTQRARNGHAWATHYEPVPYRAVQVSARFHVRPQRAALLQEVSDLRAGIAEVGQGIDRLMVMRRRELVGLPPVRSVQPPAAAPAISGPQQTAGSDSSPEPEAGV